MAGLAKIHVRVGSDAKSSMITDYHEDNQFLLVYILYGTIIIN